MFLKSFFTLSVICLCAVAAQNTDHLPPCTPALQSRHFHSGFDCESYFTCFNGAYVLQQCPGTFWFSRTQEVCARQSDVHDCEFAPPTTVAPITTPVPTNPPPTTTTISTTRAPDSVLECPSTGVTRIVNPFSCSRYFMCFDGVLIERSCSPGLFFSRSDLRCVRRDDSDCLLDNESCPAENDPNNVIFLPDQEDCQRYSVCYDGVPVEFDCGDSLHWDPVNNWCIKEEDSYCVPSFPLPPIREIVCPQDTGNDIIFLPHPEDCQFYFICLDGVSILARCAKRTLFDYTIEKCFFAESARCFNRGPADATYVQ